MAGKRITSRMDSWSSMSMTTRSMPMPRPPAGGIPVSSALVVMLAHLSRQAFPAGIALDIDAGELRDGIEQADARPGWRQVDLRALVGDARRALDFDGNTIDHLLDQFHNIIVIGVGLVAFHHGKFWIM